MKKEIEEKGIASKTIVLAVVVVIVVAAVAVAAYIYTAPSHPVINEVVIGCIEPLTGEFAIFGEEVLDGVKLAVKHVNEEGGIQSLGGAQLKLVSEDAGETVESIRLATERMISTSHPVIIEGTFMTYQQLVLNEIAERNKVIVMICSLGNEVLEPGNQNWFGLCPLITHNGAHCAQFLIETQQKYAPNNPIKSVAVLTPHEAFCEYARSGFIEELKRLSPETKIVYDELYDYNITDVTPLVEAIIRANPEVVVFGSFFYDGVLLAKGFHERGFVPRFFTAFDGTAFCDPDSIKAAGEAVEYYTNTYSYNPAKDTPTNRKFVNDFIALRGYVPTEAGGIGYYNIRCAAEALELSGKMHPEDPLRYEYLREAFLSMDLTSGPAVEAYPGDRIRFYPTGEIMDPANAVYQVQHGEVKVVWPFKYANAEVVFPLPGWKG
ncbi:MAG: ABC transporter substrate-binding protein [Candidatus Hadarchaeum sp.]|uniref:ABC transporter substrate-binding protein n=1 Tax=Candidatus Hadarchaeum sp. TaxID=2883567 RepID=UPI0031719D09